MAINVPPEEQGPGRRCCIWILFVAFLLGVIAIVVIVSISSSKQPQYYTASIDSVSGLDAAINLGGKPAALDKVEFHLTLGIKSTSPFSSDCWEPGAIVMVNYLDVQIATGNTTGQACAAGWHPDQLVRMPVVARGTAAQVPASVLDSLAADERRGVAVFDVLLQIPKTPNDDAKVVVCRGRRVGGVAEALLAPCDVL